MGYYATGTGSVVVPAENVDAAYDALVELNRREDLKTGGRSGVLDEKPADSASLAASPNKWFAWMAWNYDELLTSAVEIIRDLGFEVEEFSDDGFEVRSYDSKVGAEEHFMKALAPFVQEGSEMTWTGEWGEKWRWIFADGEMQVTDDEMKVQSAVVNWE